jgi:MYXO-CTERM domain-containing protein
MRRRVVVSVAAVALGALVGAASAQAYVRSHSSKGNTPLEWRGNCAYLIPDSAYTPDVTPDVARAAIDASASTWNSTGCSYFRLWIDPPEAGGSATMERPVGKNFIVFREDSWCPTDPKEACYDSNATALTTVFYLDKPGDPRDGQILDGDVELNNVNFAFTVDGTRPAGSGSKTVADIQNTVTHELGHLLGLDHTCYDGWNPCEGDGRCKAIDIACQTDDDCIPQDDAGQRIPRCSDALTSEVTDATMFNYAQALDTSKRTLSQDDVDGVCGIYPQAQDPGVCSRVDTAGNQGCAAAAGRAPTGGALVWLVGLALAVSRRRRPAR